MDHDEAVTAMDVPLPTIHDRLMIAKFSRKACLAAMEGKEIPLALGQPVHRLCIIRGIRYHRGFGEELRGLLPVFTRALNARNIMSDIILPNLYASDEIPYCIWHPDTASEETYRKLVERYPQMMYQVGRACAVAGYTDLYKELDILPDVHIAEEARECGNMAIFEAIVSQSIRYSIMNDYERAIDVGNLKPMNLNGDTCARWMLDIKQELRNADSTYYVRNGVLKPKSIMFHDYGCDDRVFNLTEDMHIDENESDDVIKRHHMDREEIRLLSEPLPVDLTTVQKDLLIITAAYYGDLDRYLRLRRPNYLRGEMICCVRGIYHNTPFAVWWSKQPDNKRTSEIDMAVNARFIMNNVLSGAPYKSTPYLIWYPTYAKQATYRHLAKLQPSMLPQIMHACIVAGYTELFDELLPRSKPDKALLRAAALSSSPYYKEALHKRIESTGVKPSEPSTGEGWKLHMSDDTINFFRSSDMVMKVLESGAPEKGFDAPYNGRQCDLSEVDTMMCVPEGWRLPESDEREWCTLDYKEWPPKE